MHTGQTACVRQDEPTVSPISESETDVSIKVKIVENRQIRIGT